MAARFKAERKIPEVSNDLSRSRISGVRHGRHAFNSGDEEGSKGQVERLKFVKCLLNSEAVILDR